VKENIDIFMDKGLDGLKIILAKIKDLMNYCLKVRLIHLK